MMKSEGFSDSQIAKFANQEKLALALLAPAPASILIPHIYNS